MQINVFENSVDIRFQKKKSSILKENKDIEVNNVKIRYLSIDQPQVHMKVKRGFIVSLTGPNGCGKSSLLRIIAGLVAPLNDDAVVMAPLDSLYVPQNANLINRSIIENVGLGLPRNPTKQEVMKMLNENNLKSYVSLFPSVTLSCEVKNGTKPLAHRPLIDRPLQKLGGAAHFTPPLPNAARRCRSPPSLLSSR